MIGFIDSNVLVTALKVVCASSSVVTGETLQEWPGAK